jgi:hypothetical protein
MGVALQIGAKLALEIVSGRPTVAESPSRQSGLPSFVPGAERLEHGIEKARRQKAVVVARGIAGHLAQIIARPHEFVAFAQSTNV